ncbi:hypothetical protein SASPL_124516 [Salvia splendens]|uniref:L-ascorbate oxidase n=1 Tax=Salvia splendens TaxID=180675 RepID=A0A8X8XE92_SALSN|nr:hypothetical protein SASPL_124516 [Salvia splendens]
MGSCSRLIFAAFSLCLAVIATAEDPYLFFEWNVTYGPISPLGTEQQGILINGDFPGPEINCTSNNNIVVNVFNNLDQPFLLTSTPQELVAGWHSGHHVPDPPRAELHLQVPTEVAVLLGDWYIKDHKTLQRSIGKPDGIQMNGMSGRVGDPGEALISMVPEKTYRVRVCNVGMRLSVNFRVQGHSMKLVEMEGSHTVQNTYESMDIHVGQCMSVLGLLLLCRIQPLLQADPHLGGRNPVLHWKRLCLAGPPPPENNNAVPFLQVEPHRQRCPPQPPTRLVPLRQDQHHPHHQAGHVVERKLRYAINGWIQKLR